jgi:hypothetical protein
MAWIETWRSERKEGILWLGNPAPDERKAGFQRKYSTAITAFPLQSTSQDTPPVNFRNPSKYTEKVAVLRVLLESFR